MAARRLLIVMLILLGLSTLAAALVPQRNVREGTTTGTTTQPLQTAPAVPPIPAPPPTVRIAVGVKRVAAVRALVGQQFTLLVKSAFATQLEVPEYGLVGFAAPGAPARFELLTETAGKFGILFVPPLRAGKRTVQVAARIEVAPPKQKKGKRGRARSRARAGSG